MIEEEWESGGWINEEKESGAEGRDVDMKSQRGLEEGGEEATTCWTPSLILNEMVLIRANASACPPASQGLSTL